MMRRLAFGVIGATVLAFGMLTQGSAQVLKGSVPLNVKLGLWEATAVVQSSGTPPMDTSAMTPEQRARMEAALEASRKRAATPHTMRTCITKEKLQKMPFQDRNDQSCKHTIVESTPAAYAVRFQCTGERGATTSGEWHFQAATPELVKGNGEITVENAGHKMVSTSSLTAKWVADSCGDVK